MGRAPRPKPKATETAPNSRATAAPRRARARRPVAGRAISPRAWSQAMRSPSLADSFELVDVRCRAAAARRSASRSASTPSPVSAETATTSSRRAASPSMPPRSSPSSRSTLFHTSSRGGDSRSSRPRLASTASTSAACASLSGCAHVADMEDEVGRRSTSSSVARNAATSSVGRSDTKPTVSDRIALSNPGKRTSRMVGSSVANSRSSAITDGLGHAVEQRRLAGIGVADQRDHRPRRASGGGRGGARGCA